MWGRTKSRKTSESETKPAALKRTRPFVAYYRVSTGRQQRSGLGLEAQREAVGQYLAVNSAKLVAEFSETVSGLRNDRPQLSEALRTCRVRRATLIVARLDRLSRNLAFISALAESSQDFVIVDFPDANKFTIHILAAIAEYESALISERLKSAFAAAKARGVVLGKPKGTKFPGKRGEGSAASARAKQLRLATVHTGRQLVRRLSLRSTGDTHR